ncbi:MAG: hypothetical protein R2855_09820 [Thermomicrobiales bacterium]
MMPGGSTVTITGALQNGFYPVRYGSTAMAVPATSFPQPVARRRRHRPAIDTPPGSMGRSTCAQAHGTNYSILTVAPDGATVSITGSLVNGFYPVRYNGINGYASATTWAPARNRPTPVLNTPTQQPTEPARRLTMSTCVPSWYELQSVIQSKEGFACHRHRQCNQ